MIIFCNSNYEIKDVGVNSKGDPTLTKYVIDDAGNPFESWSTAKICCYKAIVSDGKVTMMTPYLDSRLIEHIEQLGQTTDNQQEQIDTTQLGLADTFEAMETNQEAITVCEEALVEIYEILVPPEKEEEFNEEIKSWFTEE